MSMEHWWNDDRGNPKWSEEPLSCQSYSWFYHSNDFIRSVQM